MKKTLFLLCAGLLVSPTFADTVYECRDAKGRTTYTANPAPHCKEIQLKKMQGYQPPVYSSSVAETPTYKNYQPSPTTREQRIAEAEKALEEGKKMRMGNEKNYAKYQERIRQLEENLEKAKK